MNLSIDHRETLRRWMPMLLAALGAWLLLRGARRVLWTAFGMAWVFWWVSPQTLGRFARAVLPGF